MTSFCTTINLGIGTIWPARAFPAASFPRQSPARSRDAARAWTFFEQVEVHDAAVRVKYSALGGFTPSSDVIVTQSPWYIFKDESERVLYRRGKALHQQICQNTDWTSQRDLGIPTIPVTNVYPGACFDEVPVARDIRMLSVNTSPALSGYSKQSVSTSPALSGNSGSLKEFSSLGSVTTKSSSGESSRRDSIDKP